MVKKAAKKKVATKRATKRAMPKPSKKATKKAPLKPKSKPTKKATIGSCTANEPRPTKGRPENGGFASSLGFIRNAKVNRNSARRTKQQAEKTVKPELTWIVWQDTTGIGVGTPGEYKRFKWRDTIVCDVFDSGKRRERKALRLAVQLALALRQTYANYMQQHGQHDPNGQWLQYDDATQAERIQQWEERAKKVAAVRAG